MGKIWKRLAYPGVEVDNHFLLSSDGDLMNENTGRILKPEILRTGYYSVRVNLSNRNDKKHIIVHKAVAYTFIENPNGYTVINHKDGNKLNNNVNNLEWCTYSHNLQHSYDVGLFDKRKISGENNHSSKLTWDNVQYIRENYIKGDKEFGQRGMARKFNVSCAIVRRVVLHEGWNK